MDGHGEILSPEFGTKCFDAVVWWQEGHLAYKKTEWWGAGMVICLERARCRLAYGPADATATHCLLLQ